jgi:hypothetical protein
MYQKDFTKTLKNNCMKTNQIKKGSILSETSFYVVKEVNTRDITVVDDLGNEITIGLPYVEKILASADIFETEEKKTMTELAELFIGSPRIAETVAFMKKDVAKTKKAYDLEKNTKIKEITEARVGDVPRLLGELIEHPLSKSIPGELRVMKGRHYGNIDELGRITFVDMEIVNTDPTAKLRQVDPRTIQYLVVQGVKYSLK